MEYIVSSLFFSIAIVAYAVLIREKKNTLYKEDNTLCKCKDCIHAKECSAFVGKN